MERRMQKGFSLIEMSVVLTIISVVIAGVLPGLTSLNKSRELEITNQRMKAIEDALLAFRLVNERLPCPASVTINEGTANFGVEGANPGTCTGGAPSANWTTAGADGGRGGAVPVRTLNLPDEFAYDGWGRKFTYNVDRRLTAANAFITNTPTSNIGTYAVLAADHADLANPANDNPKVRTLIAAYVLWSAGPDGHGGFTANGVRFNRGITNAETLVNCNCTAAGGAGTYTKIVVQRARWADPANSLNQFDDIVTYKLRSQIETSTVLGSDLWSANGTTNLYPTATASGMAVAIGQSSLTTAPVATAAKLLVAQNASNWIALADTTAAQANMRVQANVAAPAIAVNNTHTNAAASGLAVETVNAGSAITVTNNSANNNASGITVQNASTGASWNNYAVVGSAADASVMGHLGVYNRFGATGFSGVASGEGVRGTATLLAPYAIRGLVDANNTAANSYAISGVNSSAAPGSNSYGVHANIPAAAVATNVYAIYSAIASGATISGSSYGVYADNGQTGGYGVFGRATGSPGYGVFGRANTANSFGVYGEGNAAGASGVYGVSNNATGFGVYCNSTNASGCAGNRAWTPASDQRLKKDIRAIGAEDGLEKIRKLRPVRYVWDDTKEASKTGDQFGFIAQDMQKVFPETVGSQPDREVTHSDGRKEKLTHLLGVRYTDLIAPIVKALQQLDALVATLGEKLAALVARVDTHEAEIKSLKAENAALKARLDAIEHRLDAVPVKR